MEEVYRNGGNSEKNVGLFGIIVSTTVGAVQSSGIIIVKGVGLNSSHLAVQHGVVCQCKRRNVQVKMGMVVVVEETKLGV